MYSHVPNLVALASDFLDLSCRKTCRQMEATSVSSHHSMNLSNY